MRYINSRFTFIYFTVWMCSINANRNVILFSACVLAFWILSSHTSCSIYCTWDTVSRCWLIRGSIYIASHTAGATSVKPNQHTIAVSLCVTRSTLSFLRG